MTKSKLIANLANHYPSLIQKDITKMVDIILSEIVNALRNDEFGAVELRNFGRFSLRVQNARLGRNPATGVKVNIPMKKKVHFKASSVLLKRLNED
jgi:integration host factor subunit beta